MTYPPYIRRPKTTLESHSKNPPVRPRRIPARRTVAIVANATLTDRSAMRVPWWRAPFTAETWRGLLYLLLSLPVGLLGIWAILAGLFAAAFLALFLVGFALFPLTLALVRWLTTVERTRARRLLGLRLPAPHRKPPRPKGVLRRFRARLTDRQTWRDVAYILLTFPCALLFAAVLFLIPVLLFRAGTYPFIGIFDSTAYTNDWGGPSYAGAVFVHTGQGLVVLFLMPPVVRVLTRLHATLITRFLSAG